ncbi:hypothetical protein B9Z07_12880 [Burkholderia cenocepacia]|uniref:Uncharacterized protein n=2 Tax=Burkholderia cenocepacia TaxID=95486 RepID=A0AAD0IZD4_9BURK|nr:hypothetical protein B9Z07_12880 [Burkholderia cenocepacia]EAY65611.1 hypothetical protein BCPG_03980 [Burkholderia cenocepacia PC184]MBR8305449.1 hypothetical protein [Burkholderia cenocepacia]PRE38316.1 hypothetical protein C6P63_03800 [Burkholderia cenocepacia]RQU81988.1 hypothetical protein DF049_00710 [Burkholderia cenocepacia]
MQNHSGRAMKVAMTILKVALSVVAIYLVVDIGWLFLPRNVRNGIVLVSAMNTKRAIFAIPSIIFGFYLYRLVRNFNRFSRAKRAGVAIVTLIFLAFVYLVGFRGVMIDGTDCQRFNYDVKMNGGMKQVDGITYIIKICGSGVRSNGFFGDQNEQVKLVVSDVHGSTLATRLFFVFWDGRPGEDSTIVRKNKLIYFDASDEDDNERSISLPPTILDWVAARIPIWLR